MKNNKGIYILDLANKYGIERRTAAGRLERNGIKGFKVNRRMYYILTPEVDEILKQPVRPHVSFTKKKKAQDMNETVSTEKPVKTELSSEERGKMIKSLISLLEIIQSHSTSSTETNNQLKKHIHAKLTENKPSKPTYKFNEDAPVFSVVITVK